MKFQKGFTLIELVMVIAILGILAAVAIPKYYDLTERATRASEEGVVGGVRAGIMTYYANHEGHMPRSLDAGTTQVGKCNESNPCFGTVLAHDVIDGKWTKRGEKTYQGPTQTVYVYSHEVKQEGGSRVETGSFEKEKGFSEESEKASYHRQTKGDGDRKATDGGKDSTGSAQLQEVSDMGTVQDPMWKPSRVTNSDSPTQKFLRLNPGSHEEPSEDES